MIIVCIQRLTLSPSHSKSQLGTTNSLLFATPPSEKIPSRETIETAHDVQPRSTLAHAAHDFARFEPTVSPVAGVPAQASLSLPVQFESSDVSASNRVGKACMPAYVAATCPLTQRAISEPVVAADGYVYERGAIEEQPGRCAESRNPTGN